MGKKRGQATVFIILGLVIVVFIGILFYVKQDLVKQKIEELSFKGTVVPERVQTVVFYVDSCLESLGKEGLNIMGRQGGYIELPNEIKYNNQMYLQADEFSRNPYWLSRYGSKIPTNEFMEGQLKQYIEDNFDKCNLDSFSGIGYKFSIKNLDVAVRINKEDVGIRLNSDFDTKIGEDVFSLKDYIDGKINIPLGRILETGEKIVDKEVKDGSLEFNTLNLLSAYTRDEDLPPMAGMDLKCTNKFWLKQSVKAKLREILTVNIPYLKIEGTDYTQDKGEFFDTMIWDVGVNYDDLRIDFNYYKDWDMLLDVNPSDGELIKTEPWRAGISILPVFCLNYYNFRYDIAYPVLISIYSDDYTFSFPIEVDVKDNYKRERLSSESDLSDVGAKSLFCDPEQRLSSDVSVSVIDSYTGKDVDAQVIYECGAGDQCYIGDTKNGLMKTSFPLCYNGIINVMKDGYLGYKTRFSTSQDKSSGVSVALEPFRTKNIKGMVLDNGVVRELGENEELIIYIEKSASSYESYDYSAGADFDSENLVNQVELVPGEYNVRMTLINNNESTIPAETFEAGVWPLKKKVTIPEQKISGLITGGGNFVWTIDKATLDNNKTVVFFATSLGVPKKYSDFDSNFNKIDEIIVKEPMYE